MAKTTPKHAAKSETTKSDKLAALKKLAAAKKPVKKIEVNAKPEEAKEVEVAEKEAKAVPSKKPTTPPTKAAAKGAMRKPKAEVVKAAKEKAAKATSPAKAMKTEHKNQPEKPPKKGDSLFADEDERAAADMYGIGAEYDEIDGSLSAVLKIGTYSVDMPGAAAGTVRGMVRGMVRYLEDYVQTEVARRVAEAQEAEEK